MAPPRGPNMLSRLAVVFAFVNVLTTMATVVIYQGKGDAFYLVVPWLIVALSALTVVWLVTLLVFQRKEGSSHCLSNPISHLRSLYVLLPLWLSVAIIISVQLPYTCQKGQTRVYKCLVPIASTTWCWTITVLLVASIVWICRREGCGLQLTRRHSTHSADKLVQ